MRMAEKLRCREVEGLRSFAPARGSEHHAGRRPAFQDSLARTHTSSHGPGGLPLSAGLFMHFGKRQDDASTDSFACKRQDDVLTFPYRPLKAPYG